MRLTLRSVYKDRAYVEVLWDLMKVRLNEDDPSTNISHRKLPTYKDHVRFVRSRPYRFWYIIKVDGRPAGSVSSTKLNEIGIVLYPDYRGIGVGKWALGEVIKRHKPLPAIPSHRIGRWLANFHPDNERSKALFGKIGFNRMQETFVL